MAYDKQKIFEQSKELVDKHKLFFIEDIIAFLPCTKPTFYDYFPPDSDELNQLKELLERNRIEVKSSMRSKWYKSENATLQVTLMKLIGTDEERKRMSMTHSQVEQTNKNITVLFNDKDDLLEPDSNDGDKEDTQTT